MSEHELNQYLDWEDKCNEATVNQETADVIIEWLHENAGGEGEITVSLWDSVSFVNSLVVEDEPKNYAVPNNWLDSLLTGDNAVIGSPPYDCQDIERLLNAIRERTKPDGESSLGEIKQSCKEGWHKEKNMWAYVVCPCSNCKEGRAEIALRLWEEYENDMPIAVGTTIGIPRFPDWLKERK